MPVRSSWTYTHTEPLLSLKHRGPRDEFLVHSLSRLAYARRLYLSMLFHLRQRASVCSFRPLTHTELLFPCTVPPHPHHLRQLLPFLHRRVAIPRAGLSSLPRSHARWHSASLKNGQPYIAANSGTV